MVWPASESPFSGPRDDLARRARRAGVPTVDVSGKTIVPGLWDMHTHVTQIEWAPVHLAAGVTTVPRRRPARGHSQCSSRAMDDQRRPDVRLGGAVEERPISAVGFSTWGRTLVLPSRSQR